MTTSTPVRRTLRPGHPADPTPPAPSDGFWVVNHSVPRLDGYAKVTGRAAYTGDIVPPRMTWAKLVRSPFGHARIVGIDATAALSIPGVLAVVTGDDARALPGPRYGHALRDHPVLALDRVRFAGEPVAAVVAEDERTAQMAALEVDVEYEKLAAVMDVRAALDEGSPVLHEGPYERGSFAGVPGQFDHEPNNVCYHERLEWGDVEAGLAAADRTIEAEYVFPLAYAYAMEPYVTTAHFTGERDLHVISSAQHPFMVRSDLAAVFGLPLSSVRVSVPYVGGGYGSKSYTKIEPVTALCARRVGRPVRLQLSVEEAMLTTRVAGARMWLRTGVDNDGRIVARAGRLLFDGGAYAENGPLGASKSAERVLGPYRVPNVRIDSYLVYTNTSPSSSFRGFGTSQATMASEIQLDEIARAIGVDRVELRLRNLVQKSEPIHRNARPLDGDLAGDLELAARAIGGRRDPVPPAPAGSTGQGIAVMAMGAGAYPVSTAEVRVHADDSVSVLTGSTELGQGSETVMAQIAAEALGVSIDAVSVVRSDTATTPFERSTGASRSTTLQGRALLEACQDARDRLRQMACDVSGLSEGRVVLASSGVVVDGVPITWGQVITRYFGMADAEVIGLGHVRKTGELADAPVFYELSSVGIKIEVDRDTGKVRVADLATVADIGIAIHPAMAEGQDLGAAIQGIGAALFEELVYDGEQLWNGSLLSYRVPRFSDLPSRVDLQLVENRDGVGPFGAKGAGEGAICPIAPAIVSALHDATGVWIREVPLTPERVWRALRESRS